MRLAMDPNRWKRIEELYHSALDRPPELRSEFIAAACEGDSDLARDVQDLLAYDQASDSVINRVVSENAAGMLDLTPGTKLGPYRIHGPLGSGGMGSVYRAEDTRLRRIVAIKVLRMSAGPGALQLRFWREARAISS